jgi:hypothetical protein
MSPQQAQEQPEAELEYVSNVLVVKSQGKKLSSDLVAETRESLINKKNKPN